MKHSYRADCTCDRCAKERGRREQQSRTIPAVMADWTASRNKRRSRIAHEYWDAFESGRPMSSDDY